MNPSFKHNLDIKALFGPFDWIIFFGILALTLYAIYYGNRLRKKGKESEEETFLDHLIMGRQLTLPLFLATMVATWYGGIFGVTEISFKQGIFNFVTQGLFWYVAYLIFAFFIVKKAASYKAITLPELIKMMFGKKSAIIGAIFNFFNVLPIVYAISIGFFLQILFGGPLWLTMSLGVLFVVIYSLFGGFRAVVFSDFIQFFVMCFAVFFVLVFSLVTFGGLSFLKTNLPETHFHITGGEGWAITLVWGLIALSTLVDPNFYQRIFAAKSHHIAKKGIIIATIIWFGFDICTTLGGMYARAVIPEANSAHAYVIYALQVLPPGLRGFFVAGIIATILSTLDSYLFIAGTTLSYDLMPKRLKGKLITHHLGIIVVGILAIVLGLVFDGNIKTVWKTLGSYSAACLLLPVLFGYAFPKKITDTHFLVTTIASLIAVTVWRHIPLEGFWVNVDELYIGVLISAAVITFPLLFRRLCKPLS